MDDYVQEVNSLWQRLRDCSYNVHEDIIIVAQLNGLGSDWKDFVTSTTQSYCQNANTVNGIKAEKPMNDLLDEYRRRTVELDVSLYGTAGNTALWNRNGQKCQRNSEQGRFCLHQ